jgi:hypothetical protein
MQKLPTLGIEEGEWGFLFVNYIYCNNSIAEELSRKTQADG